jgi:hypothetical protein
VIFSQYQRDVRVCTGEEGFLDTGFRQELGGGLVSYLHLPQRNLIWLGIHREYLDRNMDNVLQQNKQAI